MSERVVDVDLDNFGLLPKACVQSVFWELPGSDPGVDPRFVKEEWFSSTLLEWGACGKLVVQAGEALAFVEYAPATLFPRLNDFAAARATSADAAYMAYCYAEEGHRGRGLGTELVREVARDLAARGYRAVEAIGDRTWDGGWVLPVPFLTANGFAVIVEDARYPLLRLDLHRPARPLASEQVEVVGAFAD